LRIFAYGFKEFSKDSFKKHPGYFVSPLRMSDSAVESLFSQNKYNAGGKLDACNCITARCAHLVLQTVSAHHSGVGYHDQLVCRHTNINTYRCTYILCHEMKAFCVEKVSGNSASNYIYPLKQLFLTYLHSKVL